MRLTLTRQLCVFVSFICLCFTSFDVKASSKGGEIPDSDDKKPTIIGKAKSLVRNRTKPKQSFLPMKGLTQKTIPPKKTPQGNEKDTNDQEVSREGKGQPTRTIRSASTPEQCNTQTSPLYGRKISAQEGSQKKVVLVIEDQTLQQKIFSSWFTKLVYSEFFKVVFASTGEEGVTLFATHHPCITVVDFNLGTGMNGKEVIATLKGLSPPNEESSDALAPTLSNTRRHHNANDEGYQDRLSCNDEETEEDPLLRYSLPPTTFVAFSSDMESNKDIGAEYAIPKLQDLKQFTELFTKLIGDNL